MNSKIADALKMALYMGAESIGKSTSDHNLSVAHKLGRNIPGWYVEGFSDYEDKLRYFGWLRKHGYCAAQGSYFIFLYEPRIPKQETPRINISLPLWTKFQKRAHGLTQRLIIEAVDPNHIVFYLAAGSGENKTMLSQLTKAFLEPIEAFGDKFDEKLIQGIVNSLVHSDNQARLRDSEY